MLVILKTQKTYCIKAKQNEEKLRRNIKELMTKKGQKENSEMKI